MEPTKLKWIIVNIPFYESEFYSGSYDVEYLNELDKIKESISYKDYQDKANQLFHKISKIKQKSSQWQLNAKVIKKYLNVTQYVDKNPTCHEEIRNIAKLEREYATLEEQAKTEIKTLTEFVESSERLKEITKTKEDAELKWNNEHPSFQLLYNKDITIKLKEQDFNLFQYRYRSDFIIFLKIFEGNKIQIRQLGNDLTEKGSDNHYEEPEFLHACTVTEIGILEL